MSGSNAEGRTATSMFKMNYDILWQYVAIYGHFKQVETTARGSLLARQIEKSELAREQTNARARTSVLGCPTVI